MLFDDRGIRVFLVLFLVPSIPVTFGACLSRERESGAFSFHHVQLLYGCQLSNRGSATVGSALGMSTIKIAKIFDPK